MANKVDGFHDKLGILLEAGTAGNADYRDLVRTSLIVDADHLVLAMMLEHRPGKTTMGSYGRARDQIDAMDASEHLRLPFRGILLVGH